MGRWLGSTGRNPSSFPNTRDGVLELGKEPGVREVNKSMSNVKKAPADGIYTFNGGRYRARKGSVIPEGAKFRTLEEDKRAAPKPVDRKKLHDDRVEARRLQKLERDKAREAAKIRRLGQQDLEDEDEEGNSLLSSLKPIEIPKGGKPKEDRVGKGPEETT